MKKCYLFGFVAIILAFALAFTGCDFFDSGTSPGGGGGGGDDNISNGGGGGDDTTDKYDDLIIKVKASDNTTDIETTFSTSRKGTGTMSPRTGDNYTIKEGSSEISKGTVTVSGSLISFASNDSKYFNAVLYGTGNNSSLNYSDGIVKNSGTIQTSKPSGITDPSIGSQPQTVSVPVNGSAPLSVTVSESGVYYQWYSGPSSVSSSMAAIANGTSATYNPPTSSAGINYYYVGVANSGGGYSKSEIATVTVTGGSNPGGNIDAGNLAPDIGTDTMQSTNGSISITGGVVVTGSSKIQSGTTVTIMGTSGYLSIPDGKTVTVEGKLVIAGGGTLKADGVLVVAKGGLFDISADKTTNNGSYNGVLSGQGSITVSGDGTMNIPPLTTSLSSFSGNINVKPDGVLFQVSATNGTGLLYSPIIGKTNTNGKTKPNSTSTTETALTSRWPDFVVESGNGINIRKNNSGTVQTTLSAGKATVMGQTDTTTNTSYTTVTLNYPFILESQSTLTIGGGGTNKKPAGLFINTSGTSRLEISGYDAYVYLSDKSYILAKDSSSTFVDGSIRKPDNTLITPTSHSSQALWINTTGTSFVGIPTP